MRPVTKSVRYNEDGSPLTFHKYRDAKNDLLKELGKYCSFCEREGYKSSLAVEHILPKGLDKYIHLQLRWDNFLVGCVNCNSTKGKKDIDVNSIYLPHINNLFAFIEILEGGLLKIKENLPEDVRAKTKAFIDLVGIDKEPDCSSSDDRWESRHEVWCIANEFCKDYANGMIRLERIVQTAKPYGFLSVWLAVFKNYPEVKQALINTFSGTDATCFDADFNPIPRP